MNPPSKRALRRLLVAVVSSILLHGCNSSPTGPDDVGDPFIIEVRVTANGAGLQGVTVLLSGSSTNSTLITNSRGEGAFDVPGGGTFTVSISGFPAEVEFTSTSQTVDVTDESVFLIFDGRRTSARLSGTITVHGNGLGGVNVLVTGPGGQLTRTTDSTGAYSVDPITPGDWRVDVADVPGVLFAPSRRDLMIGDTEAAVADFNGRRVGTAAGRLSVKSDADPPHDPFVFAAGSSGKDVVLVVDSLDFDPGSPIFLSQLNPLGPSSLPSLQGPIQADDSFMLTGSGPIAGVPIVGVTATGSFSGSMFEVEITVGGNGELPGGDPVIYTFTGTVE